MDGERSRLPRGWLLLPAVAGGTAALCRNIWWHYGEIHPSLAITYMVVVGVVLFALLGVAMYFLNRDSGDSERHDEPGDAIG